MGPSSGYGPRYPPLDGAGEGNAHSPENSDKFRISHEHI